MKDGRTVALPFGTRGLEILFRESKEKLFTQISYFVFLSIPSIEKISRKAVYIKGCDIRFKVSRTYFPLLAHDVYMYLTEGIEKWRVKDYVQWKNSLTGLLV